MSSNLEDEIRALVAGMDNQENEEQQTPADDIQDIYVLIVRETDTEAEDQSNSIESEPVTPPVSAKQSFEYVTLGIVLICCIPLLASILFQVYVLQNPAIATVTIIPKSQQVTLSGTLQLGRVLQPITISQSQTVPTTGKGHQDARAATGTVTFYNGQQTEQTIAQGTVFTGSDGVSIATTQTATIPPGNPSTGYGTVSVTAQAVEAGSTGNIQAGGVNTPIALAVFVKNTQFTGGQDERDFQTVAKSDVANTATPLKTAVTQSMSGALLSQLTPQEQLYVLPCPPTVASDHHVGQEARQVKVTVSETCSAAAYNRETLDRKATDFLTRQAVKKFGSGYSFFGEIRVVVQQ